MAKLEPITLGTGSVFPWLPGNSTNRAQPNTSMKDTEFWEEKLKLARQELSSLDNACAFWTRLTLSIDLSEFYSRAKKHTYSTQLAKARKQRQALIEVRIPYLKSQLETRKNLGFYQRLMRSKSII